MARIEPDGIMGHAVRPDPDEPVLEEFRADRLVYWKAHLVMAVVLGTVAGLVLIWQGNPFPAAGPIGAAIAIAARAAPRPPLVSIAMSLMDATRSSSGGRSSGRTFPCAAHGRTTGSSTSTRPAGPP